MIVIFVGLLLASCCALDAYHPPVYVNRLVWPYGGHRPVIHRGPGFYNHGPDYNGPGLLNMEVDQFGPSYRPTPRPGLVIPIGGGGRVWLGGQKISSVVKFSIELNISFKTFFSIHYFTGCCKYVSVNSLSHYVLYCWMFQKYIAVIFSNWQIVVILSILLRNFLNIFLNFEAWIATQFRPVRKQSCNYCKIFNCTNDFISIKSTHPLQNYSANLILNFLLKTFHEALFLPKHLVGHHWLWPSWDVISHISFLVSSCIGMDSCRSFKISENVQNII